MSCCPFASLIEACILLYLYLCNSDSCRSHYFASREIWQLLVHFPHACMIHSTKSLAQAVEGFVVISSWTDGLRMLWLAAGTLYLQEHLFHALKCISLTLTTCHCSRGCAASSWPRSRIVLDLQNMQAMHNTQAGFPFSDHNRMVKIWKLSFWFLKN